MQYRRHRLIIGIQYSTVFLLVGGIEVLLKNGKVGNLNNFYNVRFVIWIETSYLKFKEKFFTLPKLLVNTQQAKNNIF